MVSLDSRFRMSRNQNFLGKLDFENMVINITFIKIILKSDYIYINIYMINTVDNQANIGVRIQWLFVCFKSLCDILQSNYSLTQPTSIFMEQLWDIGIGEI